MNAHDLNGGFPAMRATPGPRLDRELCGRQAQRAVSLHIERLVLDGLDAVSAQPHLLQAAVEMELTGLLTEGGLAAQLSGGAALPRIAGAAIQLNRGDGPSEIGRQIGGAVYEGIGT